VDHETAVEQLHGWVEGRLDPAARAALDAHLDECEECRRLSELYRLLSAARLDTAGHLSSREIVDLAVAPARLTEADRVAMEQHVASCSLCQRDLGAVRGAEAATVGAEALTERRLRVPTWAGTLAASILIALLVYPAYLGVFRLPGTTESLRALEEENQLLEKAVEELSAENADASSRLRGLEGWAGATDLWVLTDTRRDRAEPAAVRIDGPFLLVAVDVAVPPGLAPAADLEFQLVGEEGASVRSATMSASQARTQIGRSGVVTVTFLTDGLPAGAYRLRVRSAEATGDGVLFDVPVELTRSP
jgi:anti-sigma factor RsiW